MRTFLLIIICLKVSVICAQDTITLKNGRIITGQIDGITKQRVSINAFDLTGNYILNQSSIKSIYLHGIDRQEVFNVAILTADEQLQKAAHKLAVGVTTTSIGLMTVLLVPSFIKVPENFEDYEKYSKQVNTAKYIGCGIIFLGTIIEISSAKYFKRAAEKFKVLNGKDGLGVSLSF